MRLKILKAIEITSEEQWKQVAPPMGKEKQCKEGRSFMSFAKFMLDKKHRKDLGNVLKELGYDTRGEISCFPETVTGLPGIGNGRNHDLLMIGEDFVVGIEAKVTEPFGNKTIAGEYKGASENKRRRIDTLVNDLFRQEVNENVWLLRYQLLTGVVGTLYEAKRNVKSKALFLVIVFTDTIEGKEITKTNRNNKDFADFCQQLGMDKDGGQIRIMDVELTIKKIEVSLKQ